MGCLRTVRLYKCEMWQEAAQSAACGCVRNELVTIGRETRESAYRLATAHCTTDSSKQPNAAARLIETVI